MRLKLARSVLPLLLITTMAAAAHAQDDGYGDQNSYTIEEQEWYDPSDWFDEGEYEMEYQDTWDGGYEGGFYDDIGHQDDWFYDYYDLSGLYDAGYTTDYDYYGSFWY